MRVVGGAWRGRPLTAPAGRSTRPTSDRVREAIFDVLQALPELAAASGEGPGAPAGPDLGTAAGALAGHAVLDLYAGSGALGIEALSRGAARCTFVERDRAALAALRRNLASLGVQPAGTAGRGRAALHEDEERGAAAVTGHGAAGAVAAPAARVAATDVRRALQADARAGCMYTLVLADPPYARSADAQEVLARLLGRVLAPQAVIVVETSVKEDVTLPWRVVRVKLYGDTKVTVLVAG